MKIKDILFIILAIYVLSVIEFDKNAFKALITGAVITYCVMRRLGK